MASISAPTPTKLIFPTSQKFLHVKRPFYPQPLSQFPDFTLCRSSSPSSSDNSSSPSRRWHSAIEDVVKDVAKRFDSFINLYKEEVEKKRTMNEDDNDRSGGVFVMENGVEEWDWERWKKHFEQVDEQERLVSVLKLQLDSAIYREDYEDAARLKVAIAASATNDTVGRVVSNLNRAVVDERYQDAAYLRDKAGAGLVGWWAGMSEDKNDPHGLIICVTAEHGKYVARSYSPRQLATASAGVPIFEIFLTMDKKGEYKLQAVYLKQRDAFDDSLTVFPKTLGASNHLNPSGSTGDKADLLVVSTEDEDGDDRDDASDPAEGLSDFRNVLPDMIPGVRVKVLKVTAPGKVDQDFISKLIEQIIEEDDEEEKDTEAEDVGEGEDDEGEDEENDESNRERNDIEMEAGNGIIENEDRNEITFKVVVGGLVQKLSGGMPAQEFLRVPAKLDKKGLLSFSFSIEQDKKQHDSGFLELSSTDKRDTLRGQLSLDNVMFDLTKFIGKEKIPLKVLEDIGELINLSLSRAQKRQQLSGSTTFHRIETAATSDPLNGLYIGAHGLYTSEVIHLRRRFGQWQDSSGTRNPQNLEFYEYVEAIKVTGDPYVPAGQVAFRAKVGKRFQLPHKGIIPEEFGVIARYKGQGRLAEPGFKNPRWVDGELVILDGKYIKGGPVVGFVYWAPEYHFLVFFNRLRLPQ